MRMNVQKTLQVFSFLSWGMVFLSTQVLCDVMGGGDTTHEQYRASNSLEVLIEEQKRYHESLFAREEEWEKEYESFATRNWENPYYKQFTMKLALLVDNDMKDGAIVKYFFGLYHFYRPYSERNEKLDEIGKEVFQFIEFKLLPFLGMKKVE